MRQPLETPKRRILTLLGFAAVGAVMVWAVFTLLTWRNEHPRDQVMDYRRGAYKEDLNTLVNMALDDGEEGFIRKRQSSLRTISGARLKDYRDLIRRVGAEGGIIICSDGSVKIIESILPDATGQFYSSKGFLYTESTPAPLIYQLPPEPLLYFPDVRPLPEASPVLYKSLDRNWFIYYEHTDSRGMRLRDWTPN